MADPKLKSIRVVIAYTSDDFRSEATFCGGPRNPRCKDPVQALLDAQYEIARTLALFGYGEKAITESRQAAAAVAVAHARREKKNG